MTCNNTKLILDSDSFAFEYQPDWYNKDDLITHFYKTDKVVATFDEIKDRIRIDDAYSRVLAGVFNVSFTQLKGVVAAFMVTSAYYKGCEFPLKFMFEVQKVLAGLTSVCFDFIQVVAEGIFENPNVALILFPPEFKSSKVVKKDNDTYSPGLCHFYDCEPEPRKPYFVDPVFEIDERTTPMAQAYHRLQRQSRKNGQVKLYMALQQFVENHPQVSDIIYVGASPGINIAPVAIQFPRVNFYVNDIKPVFPSNLLEQPNVVVFCSIEELPLFNPDTTAYYSDVYDGQHGYAHFNNQVAYARTLPVRYVSIKRVHEWGQRALIKIKGSRLMTQVCLGPNGSELREVFEIAGPIDYDSIPMVDFERMLMYYNQRVRGSYYAVTSTMSGCNCYDCVMVSISYLRGLSRTGVFRRAEYIDACHKMFDPDHKKLLGRRRTKITVPNSDIFGDDIVMVDREDPLSVKSTMMKIGTHNYFVPPYKVYPASGTLTVMVNTRLKRADMGTLNCVSCPAHSDPGEFPCTVMLDYALANDYVVNFSCGCKKEIEVRGRLAYIT